MGQPPSDRGPAGPTQRYTGRLTVLSQERQIITRIHDYNHPELEKGLPKMQATTIQRHYDEVIASHYDFDPQSVIGDSLGRAIAQIRRRQNTEAGAGPLNVLDVGMGTGIFLEKLRAEAGRDIQPYGLDISQKMIEIARTRIPDLTAAVDDAANLDDHFQSLSFDLICTHFITGFVPLSVLAPKIRSKLESPGFWSFVGGTKAGFPELQKKAASLPLKKWLFGGSNLDIDDLVYNPASQDEVVRTLEQHGFRICECETFSPDLHFNNFNDFMEFAYYGGWLTPFVESLALHKANRLIRKFLNTFYFPAHDQHNIVIALAQKP
jgi:SAM-dependent methyltransferase